MKDIEDYLEKSPLEEIDLSLTTHPLLVKMMKEMLTTQNRLNCNFIGDDWKERAAKHESIDYLPTILDEATELMRSNTQWKFWKKAAAADHSNMNLELIDILHFAMSEALCRAPNLESVSFEMAHWYQIAYNTQENGEEALPHPLMAPSYDYQKKKQALFSFLAQAFLYYSVEENESVLEAALNDIDFEEGVDIPAEVGEFRISSVDWMYFWLTAFNMGLTLETVYSTYVGKAALNALRIAKGDGRGEYHKQWWDEEEDNKYLMGYIEAQRVAGKVSELTVETVGQWLEAEYTRFTKGMPPSSL